MLNGDAWYGILVLLRSNWFTKPLCYDRFPFIGCFYLMTQPQDTPIRPRIGARAWASIIIGLLIAAAILIAIAVVAVGVFLFLLPFVAIMALLYYLFPSRFRPRNYRKSNVDVTIIDGDFRVVHPAETERQRVEGGS